MEVDLPDELKKLKGIPIKDYNPEQLIELIEHLYSDGITPPNALTAKLVVGSWVMNNRTETKETMENTLKLIKDRGWLPDIPMDWISSDEIAEIVNEVKNKKSD